MHSSISRWLAKSNSFKNAGQVQGRTNRWQSMVEKSLMLWYLVVGILLNFSYFGCGRSQWNCIWSKVSFYIFSLPEKWSYTCYIMLLKHYTENLILIFGKFKWLICFKIMKIFTQINNNNMRFLMTSEHHFLKTCKREVRRHHSSINAF